jgi:hypothetical protein
MEQRFYLMKKLPALWSALIILGLAAGWSRAGSDQDQDLTKRLIEVYFNTAMKLAPGMTRADLAKAFREAPSDTAGSPSAFQPHQTFIYRTCGLIKADVDFRPSSAKLAGPADIITNISMPYFDFAAPTKADANQDAALTRELRAMQADFEQIKPGVTRAELAKLFKQNTGGVAAPPDYQFPFQQHVTFDYLRCGFITVDVDFAPSDSTKARPTDVITNVSKPYIDARPRV